MLADVAHHQPAAVLAVLGELLDELDVPPVDAVELRGVVVAVAAQRVHAAVGAGQLVPLLAGDLARLAADADRRVGVEPHRLGHDAPHAFSTLQTKALPSWIDHVGIADQRGQLVHDVAGDEPL